MLQDEGPGWWPDDDLKEHYKLGDYEDSQLEKILLGHKPDGREGLFIPSVPPYVKANGADGKGGGDVVNKTPPNGEDDDEQLITMEATSTPAAAEAGVKFSTLVINEEKQ